MYYKAVKISREIVVNYPVGLHVIYTIVKCYLKECEILKIEYCPGELNSRIKMYIMRGDI